MPSDPTLGRLDRASETATIDAEARPEPDPAVGEIEGGGGIPRVLERFGRYVVLGVLGKGGMGPSERTIRMRS